jgi:hypothetical protein
LLSPEPEPPPALPPPEAFGFLVSAAPPVFEAPPERPPAPAEPSSRPPSFAPPLDDGGTRATVSSLVHAETSSVTTTQKLDGVESPRRIAIVSNAPAFRVTQ